MFDLSTLATGPLKIVQARHGRFATLASDHAGIGALLRHYGEFCESEIRLLCACVDPGDLVIEVGGNIGTHTVPLTRQLASRGKVIVYEPQPIVATLLEINLALNGLTNAELRVRGAGAAVANFPMPAIDYKNVPNTGAISLLGASDSNATIPVEPIDSLDLDRPLRLIKIDVEGMEIPVLKGASETIIRHQPLIYLENNPIPRDDSIHAIEHLLRIGYKLFWDVRSLHSEDNFNGTVHPYFSDVGNSSNILAVSERHHSLGVYVSGKFGLEPIIDPTDHPLLRT